MANGQKIGNAWNVFEKVRLRPVAGLVGPNPSPNIFQ